MTLVGAFVRTGDTVVVPVPTYGMYAQASRVAGATVETVPSPGLRIDLEAVAAAVRRTGARIAWICDPNNPTGARLEPGEWQAFLDAVGPGCVVVADEAYVDYVEPGRPDPARGRRRRRAPRGDPAHVLEDLRPGRAAARLRRRRPRARCTTSTACRSRSTSTAPRSRPARRASPAPDALAARRDEVAAVRERFAARLAAGGMPPLPSAANFVLVELGADDLELTERLVRRGVLIRPGLGDGPARLGAHHDRARGADGPRRATRCSRSAPSSPRCRHEHRRAVLAAALAAHGVELVWGIPGTHNLELYAGLRAAGIRHVSPRHEQGAAFAADGYSRVTGRVGVCVTTSGPAVLNAATALAQAYSDSVPVLLVAPGMPLRHPGLGNGELHETKDLGAAMGAIVGASLRRDERRGDPGRGRPGVRAHDERPPAPGAPGGAARPARGGAATRRRSRPSRRRRSRPTPPRSTRRPRGCAPPRGRCCSPAAARAAPPPSCARSPSGSARPSCSLDQRQGHAGRRPPARDGRRLRPRGGQGAGRGERRGARGRQRAGAVGRLARAARAGRQGRADRRRPRRSSSRTRRPTSRCSATPRSPSRACASGSATAPPTAARAARWRARVPGRGARDDGARWAGVLAALGDALGDDGVLAADQTMVSYYGAVAALPAQRPRSFLYPTGYGTLGYARAGRDRRQARPPGRARGRARRRRRRAVQRHRARRGRAGAARRSPS